MISFLISALKIIFLLGFLIFIHEGGHFLVAKKCNVRVNEFAIGFGPTIWKKQGKETKYALRLIPFGGFVNLEGESQKSDDPRAFSKAAIPKRIAIVSAGALVNIIFALVTFFLISTFSGNHITTIVDNTIEDYAAQTAGIISGDEIIKVNGKRVRISSEVSEIINKNNGEEINLTIKRNGEIKEFNIVPTAVPYKATGIYLYAEGENTKIAGVLKNSSAEAAGTKEGDLILEINGDNVKNNQTKVMETISEYTEEYLKLKIERDGEILDIDIKPEEKTAYYIGVQFKVADNSFANNIYYGFWDTIDFVKSIIKNIIQLFRGETSSAELMGPVGISQVVSKTSGVRDYIYIIALISISLGITNLLPFPPLDGGKNLLLIIEAIRKKPLKEETELQIQMWGFSILIALTLYVTYHDILRIF